MQNKKDADFKHILVIIKARRIVVFGEILQ